MLTFLSVYRWKYFPEITNSFGDSTIPAPVRMQVSLTRIILMVMSISDQHQFDYQSMSLIKLLL
jgi:hypothetical protein